VIHKDFSDLRRFDIVIFLAESRLIAHYVWHVNRVVDSDRLTTRSLTPGLEDLPVTSTEIIGCIQSAEIPLWTRLRLALFGRD